MSRALSAKTFALSSYSDDAFQTFTIKDKIPRVQILETAKIKPVIKESKQRDKQRQPVPHDFGNYTKHHDFCKSFGSEVVTSAIAYHPRQKQSVYGESNRIVFLRNACDSKNICPQYPANVHGRGNGRSRALGLTEAGCSSSGARSLAAISTFGSKRILKKEPKTLDVQLKQETTSLNLGSPVDKRKSLDAPTNMWEVLNIKPTSVANSMYYTI